MAKKFKSAVLAALGIDEMLYGGVTWRWYLYNHL